MNKSPFPFEHEELVQGLCRSDPELQRMGFAAAVREAMKADDPEEIDELIGIRPDAFKIIPADRLIIAWEVDRTSIVAGEKLQKYLRLWFALDYYEWRLDLHRMDHLASQSQVNLRDLFYDERTSPLLRESVED